MIAKFDPATGLQFQLREDSWQSDIARGQLYELGEPTVAMMQAFIQNPPVYDDFNSALSLDSDGEVLVSDTSDPSDSESGSESESSVREY